MFHHICCVVCSSSIASVMFFVLQVVQWKESPQTKCHMEHDPAKDCCMHYLILTFCIFNPLYSHYVRNSHFSHCLLLAFVIMKIRTKLVWLYWDIVGMVAETLWKWWWPFSQDFTQVLTTASGYHLQKSLWNGCASSCDPAFTLGNAATQFRAFDNKQRNGISTQHLLPNMILAGCLLMYIWSNWYSPRFPGAGVTQFQGTVSLAGCSADASWRTWTKTLQLVQQSFFSR